MTGRKKATSNAVSEPGAGMPMEEDMQPVPENSSAAHKRPRDDSVLQLSDLNDLFSRNNDVLLARMDAKDDARHADLLSKLDDVTKQLAGVKVDVHDLTQTSSVLQQDIAQLKLHVSGIDEKLRLLNVEERKYMLHLHNMPMDTSRPGAVNAQEVLLSFLGQMQVPYLDLIRNVYVPKSASSSSFSSTPSNININFEVFRFDLNSDKLLRILTSGDIKAKLKGMKITIYAQMSPQERKDRVTLIQHPAFDAAVKRELAKPSRQGSVVWQLDHAVLGRGAHRQLWHISSLPTTATSTPSSAIARRECAASLSAATAAAPQAATAATAGGGVTGPINPVPASTSTTPNPPRSQQATPSHGVVPAAAAVTPHGRRDSATRQVMPPVTAVADGGGDTVMREATTATPVAGVVAA